MKYIFDFDDVLLQTTRHRKEHMFSVLEKAGIPRPELEKYYSEARKSKFSLKILLDHFSLKEDLYEEIMNDVVNFLNVKLIEIIKKLGKDNCYIVTYGEFEYQLDKIKRSKIDNLFSQIITVSSNKKEAVEGICLEHASEQVFFVDDKAKYFEDINLIKYPNLKTIVYNGQKLDFTNTFQ